MLLCRLTGGADMLRMLLWLSVGYLGGWSWLVPTVTEFCNLVLAVFGLVLAIWPLKDGQKNLKWASVAFIIVLAIVGMLSISYTRAADLAEKSKLEEEQKDAWISERDARVNFGADLAYVRQTSEATLRFVANPPKGYTLEQVSAVARTMIAAKSHDQASALKALASVSGIVQQIETVRSDWATKRKAIDDKQDAFRRTNPTMIPGDNKELQRLIQEEWIKAKPSLDLADNLRPQLLEYIPSDKRLPEDATVDVTFNKRKDPFGIDPELLQNIENYMNALVVRVSANLQNSN
jgi:hypothetical protein